VISGVRMEDFEVNLETAFVDLSVTVERTDQGTVCYFTYSRDLFNRSRIARLAEDYAALLQAAARAPDRPVSMLLSPEDQTVQEAEDLLLQLEQMGEEEAERVLHPEGNP